MNQTPRLFIFEMHQDDPSKCTAAKMRKLGLARGISKERIPSEALVLNPGGQEPVSSLDKDRALRHGLVVVDCSWSHAPTVFSRFHFRGTQRRLPALLAGNPTNYSKLGLLSSLEAMAGALYVLQFYELSKRLLSIYKWGPTFLSLNQELLQDYANASNVKEIQRLEGEYFPHLANDSQS